MSRSWQSAIPGQDVRRASASKRAVAELEAQLAAARKHSGNSSKPPSSDIVKPSKSPPEGEDKRKIGGQPGHPRHERPAFPPELIDEPHDYTLEQCPDCGGKLQDAALAPKVIQQVEILVNPLHIAEHRGQAYWCPKCQQVHYAPLPAEVVKAGPGGTTADSPGWLPQGSLPCFVFHDSQVSPRCRRCQGQPWAVGQSWCKR